MLTEKNPLKENVFKSKVKVSLGSSKRFLLVKVITSNLDKLTFTHGEVHPVTSVVLVIPVQAWWALLLLPRTADAE